MRFLDAFQGYYQISLALGDQEKTVFVTPTGNYHYKVMPFELKNAGSTYQRMMTMMFKPQLSKNIEVYIDDMVVKSNVVSEHMGDLGNIFEILRRHKLCLMLPNVLLTLAQVNFWAIWSLTVELKSTLITLRQLTICNFFGISKRSRS